MASKKFSLTGRNLGTDPGLNVGYDLTAPVGLRGKEKKEEKEGCWVVEMGKDGERGRGGDDRETATAKYQSYGSKDIKILLIKFQ